MIRPARAPVALGRCRSCRSRCSIVAPDFLRGQSVEQQPVLHRQPSRWLVRCAPTRTNPPRGVMTSQTYRMNDPVPAVSGGAPASGQHSAEHVGSSEGAVRAVSGTSAGAVASSDAQHEAAHVVVDSGSTIMTALTWPLSAHGVVSVQQEATQTSPPVFKGVEESRMSPDAGSEHGVGQQSSGPANAAKEIRLSPTSPMSAGDDR